MACVCVLVHSKTPRRYLASPISWNTVYSIYSSMLHSTCTFLCTVVLFMGSEKYPVENELDEFISRHGGTDDAMTDYEMVSRCGYGCGSGWMC